MPHNSKVPMEDVGYKVKNNDMPSSPDKDKMRYPKMRFDDKVPSKLKKKTVGNKCKFYGEGEVSAMSSDEYGESATIEVHSIGIFPANVSEKEYKGMSDDDKDKADEDEVMGKK